MKEITSKQGFEEAIKSNRTVLIQFTAPWCNPCKVNTPDLEKISQEKEQFAEVHTVNIDQNADIVEQQKISSIPTILVHKDGERTHTLIGIKHRQEIEDTIDMAVVA